MAIGANCAIDLAQVARNNADNIGEPLPPFEDVSRNMSWIGSFFSPASALARKSEYFRKVFDNTMEKMNYRNLLLSDHEDMLAKLSRLPVESQQRINAVLEYLRLSRAQVSRTGRKLSIKTRPIEREGKDGENRVFRPSLSKPGDVLSLTKEETEILHEIRDWLDSRYTLNGKSILAGFGYTGEYSLDGIKALPDATPEDVQFRDSLLKLFTAYESQRLMSYIPFMRSGDIRVMVYGPDGTLDTGAFYMLDTKSWLRKMVSPKFYKAMKDPDIVGQIRAIQKKYPASDGFTIKVTTKDIDRSKQLGLADIGTLDKLLGLMDASSGRMIKEYFDDTMGGMLEIESLPPELRDAAKRMARGFVNELPSKVKSILMEQVTAGFMKQSRDIAGYDTNFINRLFDYNSIVATTVSHRLFRKGYSLAYDDAMSNVDKPEKKYLKRWDEYIDTPEHAFWRAARTIGFFNSMWGSFASGGVNAFAAWTVVAPQMTVFEASAGLEMYKLSAAAISAIRGRPGIGMMVDPRKIPGLTEKEQEALVLAIKRGTVRAQINPELMGMEAGMLVQNGGKLGKTMSDYFQIGSSVVSVMEEMPKYAAFITAYRYAQKPKALANWKEAFKGNLRAQAIMDQGSDPFKVAEFMVETTTFIGGQIEKPPILREQGGVILQFSQYPIQLTRLLYENFATMGPRGRVAGMFTILSLWSAAGLLFAFPLGDDALNVFEYLYNLVFSEGRNFRLETQQMLVDMFGGDDEDRLSAEALMYGPFRAFLGVDIGQRIGYSSLLPELNNPVTAIPALSVTVGKWQEAMDRYKSGQPIGAGIAALSPFMGKGVSDVARAFVQYPDEGYRTRYGSVVMTEDDITAGDKFARALGLQSASIARKAEARREEKRIEEGTRGASRNLTVRLSAIMADAIRAQEAGNVALSNKLYDKFSAEYQKAVDDYAEKVAQSVEKDDPNIMARAIKPPSSQSLNDAVRVELYPELTLDKRGKAKVPAILEARETIFAGDKKGDLFLDNEDDVEGLLEEE